MDNILVFAAGVLLPLMHVLDEADVLRVLACVAICARARSQDLVRRLIEQTIIGPMSSHGAQCTRTAASWNWLRRV